MNPQTAQLKLIRETFDRASKNWQCVIDDGKEILTVNDIEDGELVDLATITALNPADSQLIRCSHEYISFLLDLVYASFREIKRAKACKPPEQQKPDKDYAAQCAVHCNSLGFKKFLQEVHGMPEISDIKEGNKAAAEKVRQLLDITSRAQLNKSWDKSQNWLRLYREFKGWMQEGGLNTP